MFSRLGISYCVLCLVVVVVVPIASQPVTLLDLTYEFSHKTPTFPGHKRFASLGFKRIHPNPDAPEIRFAVQEISGSEHAGTHMDSPLHFKDGGISMEEIPIEQFTGPAVVIDIEERARRDENTTVTQEDLENWERKYGKIPENAFVLMNSGWSNFWEDEKKYIGNDRLDVTGARYPGFSEEACKWLAENRKINGAGVDTAGLDPGISMTYPCHYLLSEYNIVILENVFNVGALPLDGATLRAYPMKIKGGTGAPTRIIASFNQRRATHAENEL